MELKSNYITDNLNFQVSELLNFDHDVRTFTFFVISIVEAWGEKPSLYTDDERPIPKSNIKVFNKKILIDLPNAAMTNKSNENIFKMFILQPSLFIASLSRNRLPFQVGIHSVVSGCSFYMVWLELRRVKQT